MSIFASPRALIRLLTAPALLGAALTALGATQAELDDYLARIKSDQGPVRVEAIMKAGPLGADAVVPLGKIASGDNRDAALAAQTALKHLAAYAGRPGAAEERKAVARNLTLLLGKDYSKVTRCLSLELLSIVGDDAVVPQVAPLLQQSEADVADEARRCLQALPGSASLKALTEALARTGGRLRLSVVVALGQRAAPEAVEALIPLTGSPDSELMLEALDALARIGVPKDDRIQLPSWDALNDSQRQRLANSMLRWADRRAAKGAADDALEAYAGIVERASSEHLICAALIGAAKASPDQAFPHVVSALGHERNTVRATAAQILERLPGSDDRANALLDAYKTAKPDGRDLILRVLKAWNDAKLGAAPTP